MANASVCRLSSIEYQDILNSSSNSTLRARQVRPKDDLGFVSTTRDKTDMISATTRHILPSLRQYSSWLVSSAPQLVAFKTHQFPGVQIKEFWRVYADALALLLASFQEPDLPGLSYLLEEDEDTLAFTPFMNPSTSRRYFQDDGLTLKPRSRCDAVQRHHPSIEMLLRARGLVEDGKALVARKVLGPSLDWFPISSLLVLG